MDSLKRAAECIDNFQAIVRRLNEEASGVNGPTSAPQVSKKISPNGVLEELIPLARNAIQAILDALASEDRRVHDWISGGPPEWWRNLRTIMRDKRAEYAASHPALLNAFDVLDRHVSDDNAELGGLVFLVEDLHSKIMKRPSQGLTFSLRRDPNPHEISFVFDPQFDDQIDQSLRELLSEVFIFPIECVALLRTARNAAAEIIKH